MWRSFTQGEEVMGTPNEKELIDANENLDYNDIDDVLDSFDDAEDDFDEGAATSGTPDKDSDEVDSDAVTSDSDDSKKDDDDLTDDNNDTNDIDDEKKEGDDKDKDDDGDTDADEVMPWADLNPEQKIQLPNGDVVTLNEFAKSTMLESDYNESKEKLTNTQKDLETQLSDVGNKALEYDKLLGGDIDKWHLAEQQFLKAYQDAGPEHKAQRLADLQEVQADKAIAMNYLEAEKAENDQMVSQRRAVYLEETKQHMYDNVEGWDEAAAKATVTYATENGYNMDRFAEVVGSEDGKIALTVIHKARLFDEAVANGGVGTAKAKPKGKSVNLKSKKGAIGKQKGKKLTRNAKLSKALDKANSEGGTLDDLIGGFDYGDDD